MRPITILLAAICCCLSPLYGQPDLECAENLTLVLDENENGQISVEDILISVSTQGIPIIDSTLDTPLFSCSDVGINSVSLKLTDSLGNSASCTTNVFVEMPLLLGIACAGTINLTLGDDCTATVLPEFILQGSYPCIENYIVNIEGRGTDILTSEDVGQLLNVSVTEPFTGLSCLGQVQVYDNTAPIINQCEDSEIFCFQDSKPENEGGDVPVPEAVDCSDYTWSYSDILASNDCMQGDLLIERYWVAADIYGNSVECIQLISIQDFPAEEYSYQVPASFVTECSLDGNYDLSPDITGYPFVEIGNLSYEIRSDQDDDCIQSVSWEDVSFGSCGKQKKIWREWSVYNWCTPFGDQNPWRGIQLIEIEDTSPPILNTPPDITMSVNSSNCAATPPLPSINIEDCSFFEVFVETPVGTIMTNGGQIPVPGLPIGQHTIQYTVIDECGNTALTSFQLTVEDHMPPIAVCISGLTVSLGGDGTAALLAGALNGGSNDPCGIDHFEAKRLTPSCLSENPGFGDFLLFDCCDVENGPIPVTLRVYDLYGNWNESISEVTVVDNIVPQLICPPDIEIDCSEDYLDFSITEEATSIDNCLYTGLQDEVEIVFEDEVNISDCGTGTVFRSWSAIDGSGNTSTCTQQIDVIKEETFTELSIQWPEDYTLFLCDSTLYDIEVTGMPIFDLDYCNLVTAGYSDVRYDIALDACYLIMRDWEVIDWCQYPDGGRWTYTQQIKVQDVEPPIFTDYDDRVFCNTQEACMSQAVELPVKVWDNCTDSTSIQINWQIDAFNDGTEDFGSIFSGTGMNTGNSYPNGTHLINYFATDGCGNQATCSFLFTIEDCESPIAKCLTGGLSVELMQSGEVTVGAMDFDAGSFDDCSEVIFSFSPDASDTYQTFTCDDAGTHSVEVWVTDEAGNQDFCETYMIIQDNLAHCDNKVFVEGRIFTEDGKAIQNVAMAVSGLEDHSADTNIEGVFAFDQLEPGNDYTITPYKDSNPLNGVTTFDLILIRKHILGITNLDSPYKFIAADVNRSGSISTFDMIQLRKLILNIYEDFPDNTSWRFVDADFEFPENQNPLTTEFPEVISFKNLEEDIFEADFAGVKVGDINGSSLPNTFIKADDRSAAEAMIIHCIDQDVKAGQIVEVELKVEDIEAILGFQFTLLFERKALELQHFETGIGLSKENFGFSKLDLGAINCSWENFPAIKHEDNFQICKLIFKANKAGKISDFLTIGSDFTPIEAYTHDEKIGDIYLKFIKSTKFHDFKLLQNYPNPFSKHTTVIIYLPEPEIGTFSVADISGRVVISETKKFNKGYNELIINNNQLIKSGVYVYQIETSVHRSTGKMVFIK